MSGDFREVSETGFCESYFWLQVLPHPPAATSLPFEFFNAFSAISICFISIYFFLKHLKHEVSFATLLAFFSVFLNGVASFVYHGWHYNISGSFDTFTMQTALLFLFLLTAEMSLLHHHFHSLLVSVFVCVFFMLWTVCIIFSYYHNTPDFTVLFGIEVFFFIIFFLHTSYELNCRMEGISSSFFSNLTDVFVFILVFICKYVPEQFCDDFFWAAALFWTHSFFHIVTAWIVNKIILQHQTWYVIFRNSQ